MAKVKKQEKDIIPTTVPSVPIRPDYFHELRYWAGLDATTAKALVESAVVNYLGARRRTDRAAAAEYRRRVP